MRGGHLLLAGLTLFALAGCGTVEGDPVARSGVSPAATISPTPSTVTMTAEQRERYSIVPSVDPDPEWCGPVNSAVVIARQVIPSQALTEAMRQGYQEDAMALGGLPGLPSELQQYLSNPAPAFDETFVFVWGPYEQFGQAKCPATEAYKLAHASGPKERQGGFGFVPYAIPSPETG